MGCAFALPPDPAELAPPPPPADGPPPLADDALPPARPAPGELLRRPAPDAPALAAFPPPRDEDPLLCWSSSVSAFSSASSALSTAALLAPFPLVLPPEPRGGWAPEVLGVVGVVGVVDAGGVVDPGPGVMREASTALFPGAGVAPGAFGWDESGWVAGAAAQLDG